MLRNPEVSERGSTLPLIIGLFALCTVVVLLVASASTLLLGRLRLLAIADGAALAAAESFEITAVHRGVATLQFELDEVTASRAAAGYISSASSAGLEDVRLVSVSVRDGRSVQVELVAKWLAPWPVPFTSPSAEINASSSARLVLK